MECAWRSHDNCAHMGDALESSSPHMQCTGQWMITLEPCGNLSPASVPTKPVANILRDSDGQKGRLVLPARRPEVGGRRVVCGCARPAGNKCRSRRVPPSRQPVVLGGSGPGPSGGWSAKRPVQAHLGSNGFLDWVATVRPGLGSTRSGVLWSGQAGTACPGRSRWTRLSSVVSRQAGAADTSETRRLWLLQLRFEVVRSAGSECDV